MKTRDSTRLSELMEKVVSVNGWRPESFEVVVMSRTLDKLLSIMDNPEAHFLLLGLKQSTFSSKLLQLCCHKDRHTTSFLPTATTISTQHLSLTTDSQPKWFWFNQTPISLHNFVHYVLYVEPFHFAICCVANAQTHGAIRAGTRQSTHKCVHKVYCCSLSCCGSWLLISPLETLIFDSS